MEIIGFIVTFIFFMLLVLSVFLNLFRKKPKDDENIV